MKRTRPIGAHTIASRRRSENDVDDDDDDDDDARTTLKDKARTQSVDATLEAATALAKQRASTVDCKRRFEPNNERKHNVTAHRSSSEMSARPGRGVVVVRGVCAKKREESTSRAKSM